MISNRSVPCDTVLPHVMYHDLPAALAWLTGTLGFTEHYRYGDPLSGAQILLGKACIILKQAPPDRPTPAQLGFGTQSLTVFIEELEAHYQRAKAAGVHVLEEVHETCYGELQYAISDLEGHHWLFSRHARNLSPAEWGATLTASKP